MRPSVLRVLFSILLLGIFPSSLSSQEPVAAPQAQAHPAAVPEQGTQQPAQPAPQTPPGQQVPPPSNEQATKDNNGTFTIQRTARLVVLDMVVTDANGNIVTDLKRDDFHVDGAERTADDS